MTVLISFLNELFTKKESIKTLGTTLNQSKFTARLSDTDGYQYSITDIVNGVNQASDDMHKDEFFKEFRRLANIYNYQERSNRAELSRLEQEARNHPLAENFLELIEQSADFQMLDYDLDTSDMNKKDRAAYENKKYAQIKGDAKRGSMPHVLSPDYSNTLINKDGASRPTKKNSEPKVKHLKRSKTKGGQSVTVGMLTNAHLPANKAEAQKRADKAEATQKRNLVKYFDQLGSETTKINKLDVHKEINQVKHLINKTSKRKHPEKYSELETKLANLQAQYKTL